jgi:hypothetical protein
VGTPQIVSAVSNIYRALGIALELEALAIETQSA